MLTTFLKQLGVMAFTLKRATKPGHCDIDFLGMSHNRHRVFGNLLLLSSKAAMKK
jgi:hypothetical protein